MADVAAWPPPIGLTTKIVPRKDAILTISYSTVVHASAPQVFETILRVADYSAWNTWIPAARIVTQPPEADADPSNLSHMRIGSTMEFEVVMNADKPDSITRTQLKVVDICTPSSPTSYLTPDILEDPSFTADLDKVYRVSWTGNGGMGGMAPKLERFHEVIVRGNNECEVRSWEIMTGVVSRIVKFMYEDTLKEKVGLWQPPALQILERLEYLIALVESNHDASTHVHDIHSQLPSHTDVSARLGTRMSFTPSSNADAQITSPMSHHPNLTVHDDQYEQSPLNCCAKSSEDVLEWPVFQRRYDRHSIETLIFEPTSPSEATNISGISSKILPSAAQAAYDDPREGLAKGIGICEDDVPNLVEKFLVNVHVKNPIFDPEYLRDMAREVAEDGFGWKAPSCLVLIVCALASISSHFVHESSLGSSREAASMDHSLANTLGHFPAPPLATTEDDFYRMHSKFDSNSTTTSLVRPPTELEEGWYYYLADIAARRILQRVIGSFYEADQSSWLRTPFQNMSHTASELDRQLMEWLVLLRFESASIDPSFIARSTARQR
ncbi:hypothetical protein TW65_07808 [Stemphylium lycopersici]|nr:hypothetical protein TW65_07808 [Stemphylium lycopersici]